jgi:hypothetical protein
MFKKLREYFRLFLGRFLAIEAALFGIVGLISLLFHFNYGTALVVIGAITLILRFSATSRNNLTMATGNSAMEKQILKDIQDTGQIRRAYGLFNDLFVIGCPCCRRICTCCNSPVKRRLRQKRWRLLLSRAFDLPCFMFYRGIPNEGCFLEAPFLF